MVLTERHLSVLSKFWERSLLLLFQNVLSRMSLKLLPTSYHFLDQCMEECERGGASLVRLVASPSREGPAPPFLSLRNRATDGSQRIRLAACCFCLFASVFFQAFFQPAKIGDVFRMSFCLTRERHHFRCSCIVKRSPSFSFFSVEPQAACRTAISVRRMTTDGHIDSKKQKKRQNGTAFPVLSSAESGDVSLASSFLTV